jgi:hypothetical protein
MKQVKIINSYDFGRITIDNKEYRQDVIIYPQKVNSHWRRIEGHRLDLEDIQEILKDKPQVLIIGTGYSGLMKVSSKTKEYLEAEGVKTIVEETRKAYQSYNKLCKEAKVVAALHLTC